MGQKGLSTLHRIDASMVWQSNIYNKKYRWLSYNLWFAYVQFYKIIFYIDRDFYLYNNLTYDSRSSFITKKYKNIYKIYKNSIRFSYHIELYCFEFYKTILLFNIYFKTNLFFYKNYNRRRRKKKLKINSFF